MAEINSKKLKPKTKRGIRTKFKVLEAAEKVFGQLGYYQASINDITKEAEVALGTFYTYFQSKEEIFTVLVKYMLHKLKKEIAMNTVDLTDRIELEREGFKIYFSFIQKHPYYYRLMRQAEFVDDKLYRKLYESFADGYIKRLSIAMTNNEIRNIDPELLVYCFMGITDYVGMKCVLWENREINDEVIDELMSFIKHGIVPGKIDAIPESAARMNKTNFFH